ncbi:MAG TPA: TIR domain-containing protein, partial [Anaerolineales bacterium]|nr:TIR domain-containing protein [Anaerolineales bacterium]
MARKLTDALKGQDLDFWIDWEGIPPTVDWWEEIQKGIEEADIFLFLISPDSANSKVCKREIEHAVQNGKRLIPVVVRDVTATEVPYELSSLNWIFLREADDFNPAFGKLITAIKTDYAWAQAHRQLQVKALEWDRSNHENSFLLRGKELQSAELQLATNSSKEPHPTDLQRAYVLRSRQTADRQRRIITFMAIGAAIAMTGLAIFGFVQARLATERATLSRAGELAAQSVALRDRNFPVSLLLSVEAFKTRDTVQTRSALVDDIQASPGLLAYLTRNPSRVDSVAFSPDGKILASGGGDNKIILWDVGTGQPIGQPLKKHRNWIRSLAFAPDGKILASGGNDGSVILWDLKTSQPIGQPLKAKKGVVSSVAFTPDGKILASGHADGTLILWDVRTHQPLGQPLRGHTSWISSLAISPDGKTLASGSEDHTIILWDIKTQQPIDQPLSAHSRTILSLAFSPDGKMLASGSEDNTVVLWDAARRRPIGQPLRGHTKFVGSVAFSPDGKLLASGGYDRIIILWEVATRQPIGQPLRGHTDVIHSVTFSADGKMLASGSEDGTIILWDVATALHPTLEPGAFISQVLREHAKPVNSVAFSPDGRNLASGDNDGTLILWDVSTLLNISIKTKRPIGLALQDHTNVVSSLAFTPDGKILASGSSDGTVILWDVSAAHNTGAKTEQAVKRTLTGNGDFITTIAFSPDGKTLAAGAGNSSILLWDVKTGRLIGQPLPGHTNIV